MNARARSVYDSEDERVRRDRLRTHQGSHSASERSDVLRDSLTSRVTRRVIWPRALLLETTPGPAVHDAMTVSLILSFLDSPHL